MTEDDATVIADSFVRAHHTQMVLRDEDAKGGKQAAAEADEEVEVAFSGTTHDVVQALVAVGPSPTMADAAVSTIRDLGTPLSTAGLAGFGRQLHCDLVVGLLVGG